jgi:hypothetical protein
MSQVRPPFSEAQCASIIGSLRRDANDGLGLTIVGAGSETEKPGPDQRLNGRGSHRVYGGKLPLPFSKVNTSNYQGFGGFREGYLYRNAINSESGLTAENYSENAPRDCINPHSPTHFRGFPADSSCSSSG